MSIQIIHSDCLDVMRGMPDASVDSVATDPPYHLTAGKKGGTGVASLNLNSPAGRSRIGTGFMGCKWDAPEAPPIDADFANWLAGFIDGEGCFSVHKKNVNGCETYDCQFSITLRADDKPILQEIQRRLGGIGSLADRPGKDGNAQARYCVSSQNDCAFLREILTVFPLRAKKARDFIAWSHALDCWLQHRQGEWEDMTYYRDALMAVKRYGSTFSQEQLWHYQWARQAFRVLKPGGHLVSFGGTRTYHRMVCAIEDAGFEIRDQLGWLFASGFPKSHNLPGGWGTALKPAWEPICLARKPLSESTVAANVLKHGTGAINIDGCRVETDWESDPTARGWQGGNSRQTAAVDFGTGGKDRVSQPNDLGRWPANICHDGSPEVLDAFARFGERKAGVAVMRNRDGEVHNQIYGEYRKPAGHDVGFGDTGTAARFFFCAKASREEREIGLEGLALGTKRILNGGIPSAVNSDPRGMSGGGDRVARNTHPTVKPLALMQWLCRLITPPGGTILDPFLGSGTTAIAADREGFSCIGIEREAEYVEIARGRVAGDAPLFSDLVA